MSPEMFSLLMLTLENNASVLSKSAVVSKIPIEKEVAGILTIIVNALRLDRDKFDLNLTAISSLHKHLKKWVPPSVPFHPSHN